MLAWAALWLFLGLYFAWIDQRDTSYWCFLYMSIIQAADHVRTNIHVQLTAVPFTTTNGKDDEDQ